MDPQDSCHIRQFDHPAFQTKRSYLKGVQAFSDDRLTVLFAIILLKDGWLESKC